MLSRIRACFGQRVFTESVGSPRLFLGYDQNMANEIDLPNGYFVVPPGKLANAVTWLEMRARPPERLAEPLRLVAATDQTSDACRKLFAEIGTPWLWSRAFDRTDRIPVNTFSGYDDTGRQVGVVELSSQKAKDIEISFFGLIPTATGGGLGRRLMEATLDLAWRTADRVWLHTCSFDHPGALRFYQSCGFVAYASGFEIMNDPRLDGSLPLHVAPHVPLIGTS